VRRRRVRLCMSRHSFERLEVVENITGLSRSTILDALLRAVGPDRLSALVRHQIAADLHERQQWAHLIGRRGAD